jgi:hypothetical protein
MQFCRWMTTIEGSLEPLCRLTHSIIQARRCRPVSMRFMGLGSGCRRALATGLDLKAHGHSQAERCVGLQLRHPELC